MALASERNLCVKVMVCQVKSEGQNKSGANHDQKSGALHINPVPSSQKPDEYVGPTG
jgi:hypothetical protein